MKNIILIPSYEPDKKIINLLKKLTNNNNQCFDIIVVDDGSGNNYENIFNEVKNYAYVISYITNKGKGYALKEGLKYIKT